MLMNLSVSVSFFAKKKITCIKTPFFLLQISKYFKISRKSIFLSKHYDLYVFPEFDLKNEKTYDFCRKEMHFTIFVIIYFFILIFNIFNPSLTIDIHTSKDDFLEKHMWIQTYSCRAIKYDLTACPRCLVNLTSYQKKSGRTPASDIRSDT